MTTNKDQKKLVRERMAKTGESYTAVRAQMLGAPESALSPSRRADRATTTRSLPLVLDTNIVRFAAPAILEQLAKRGFSLRVAEVAFGEWWARSVEEHESGKLSRRDARAKFFGRAQAIAPHLDPTTPVAVGAGELSYIVRARADGVPPPESALARVRGMPSLWANIVGPELGDEEWIEQGRHYGRFLDALDDNLRDLARRDGLLDANVPPELADQNARWKAMPRDEKHRELRAHVQASAKLSDAAAERVDAYIQSTTHRLLEGASGAREPKRNDGADLSMLNHLGDECILVTRDLTFIKLVDMSGTFQAPWVRNVDELDDTLPEVVAWGPEARSLGTAFRRRVA